MTTHRVQELIRIATTGICQSEFELQFLSERKRFAIHRLLVKWKDEPEFEKYYEINYPTIVE